MNRNVHGMVITCATAVFNAIKGGNRDRLIRCVNSIAKLKATHEHLIYDGGSDDGTVSLLHELTSRVPCVKIVSGPDGGVYNALNKGVNEAQGKWFYVLGCDDYVIPEAMDALVARYDASPAQVVVAPTIRDNGDGEMSIHTPDCRRLLWSTPYCHQGVLMRTSLVRTLGGFDERFMVCADYDMMLKCHMEALPIAYESTSFAVYGAGGLSDNRDRLARDYALVMKEHFHLSDLEIARVQKDMLFPFFRAFALCFHADAGIRRAACHALSNWQGWLRRHLRNSLCRTERA